MNVLDMCFVQKKLHETYFKMICNVHKKKMNRIFGKSEQTLKNPAQNEMALVVDSHAECISHLTLQMYE